MDGAKSRTGRSFGDWLGGGRDGGIGGVASVEG